MAACGNCGSENPASAKFCAQCGQPLSLACPSCGSPYAAGAKFCMECGTPLAGQAVPAPAVMPGGTGDGLVAGDLVNTASRIQSVAEPGSVFVGETTRRASERAVVYEEAGSFELKGKEGETPLWRALRIVSGRGGGLRSEGLEAPFVGRDRELRQIKDLFHVSAEERRAQLVSVSGIAGIGKSRLAWEFYKYFDGIAETVYWHRGRCLSYGEGVTYWALADMVRMRCRIAEDEDPEAALAKLGATLEEHVLDAEERRFVEPKLAQLLGLGTHESRERQELFAAWRLFFERLAESYPTVLAFEDMQWADASLLDFVEYLLEWSRGYPLFVITLARPELQERRPTWGAGHRNFVSLYLEPLSERAMEELLQGLVPGLPASLREQILARAAGVPLYAVETVRMLLDRGLLVEDGSSYRVVGEVAALEVPETLHALVAARLDGLSAEERKLLQDAAVLGKTFTPAAAEHLPAVLGEEEVAEVVASHLLEAYRLDPEAPDAEPLKARAQTGLAHAGERAASLGASAEAQRYFEQAGELADEPAERAAPLVRAGEMAVRAGADERAGMLFEQAIELYRRAGDTHAAARASTWLALVEENAGRYEEAIERMEHAYAEIANDEPDSDLVLLLTRLGGAHYFAGNPEQGAERNERALDVAEALQLPEAIVGGWMLRAITIGPRRPREAESLYRLALETALEYELQDRASLIYANRSDLGFQRDRYADSLGFLEQALVA